MEQKDCEWWVDDSEADIGNYTHDNAIKHDSGFCLLQDLFTKCSGKCEDFYKNDKARENKS